MTPFLSVSWTDSPGAVELLIELGADVSAVDRKTRSTPLHRAVTSTGAPSTAGKAPLAVDIARILLSSGADPQAKNKSGKTPADYVTDLAMQAVFRTYASGPA